MSAVDRIRRAWENDGTAIGLFVFSRLDPVAVEALGKVGYDYVCIDLQHGLMSFADMVAMLQALALGDATPIVRVPANDPAIIGRVLDAGAVGVIVPMVNSAREAARAVAACRYAPEGVRSFGPVRAGMAYGKSYPAEANGRILCIPMIETAEAVAQAEAIVAVPGVDAVYVGPTDLSLTYGLAPLLDNGGPFADALSAIAAAAVDKGVVAGVHANVALAAARRATGFRMITVTNDMAILNAGFASELSAAHASTGIAPTTIERLQGAY